jgi:hypothetical protein
MIPSTSEAFKLTVMVSPTLKVSPLVKFIKLTFGKLFSEEVGGVSSPTIKVMVLEVRAPSLSVTEAFTE